ncbi:MAG: hypothetical protein WA160_15940 [Pseudobdellovibrio sp.]
MKKIGFLLALVISKMVVAQTMDISLNVEGVYKKTSPLVIQHTTRKDCQAAKGVWSNKRKACRINEDVARVKIEKADDNTYKLEIDSLSGNHTCNFLGVAQKINKIQLQAQDENCQITVGFTNPDTLSVWTAGSCDCGDKASITMDGVMRSKNSN